MGLKICQRLGTDDLQILCHATRETGETLRFGVPEGPGTNPLQILRFYWRVELIRLLLKSFTVWRFSAYILLCLSQTLFNFIYFSV